MENASSRFGQHLAHTEKKYRDRALKKLTVYLSKKKEWTPLEWDKLWKALFYCMWMSDKRPVQEELSTNLAALVHRLPSANLALQFVHSFFRTMHREWHGLDGLRLDKFYSLVRKFVRETVALLRTHDWTTALVRDFVTILATEVMSQVPNGLRMHLADVYLAEIHTVAADVTTDAFVKLLEPFFTLVRSESDKTVVKRVRELVFEALVTTYRCRSQIETHGDTGETDEEEETRGFDRIDLAQVQHRVFAIASADDTAERNRAALYTLYKQFFRITHVDSFQTAIEMRREVKTEVGSESKKRHKLTTRKVQKDVEGDEMHVGKEDSRTQGREDQTIATTRKERTTPETTRTDEQVQQKKSYVTVTRSGKKFKRCTVCGGFGRGLVSKDKTLCGHCERAQKTLKKVASLSSKKRKAEALAQAVREAQEKTELSKRVTFGKSKALRHVVSVKRLRASAQRDHAARDREEIKSVLKRSTRVVATTQTTSTGRKTAADFM